MSISNRHQVVEFISGQTKPMTGQRLARVGYKGHPKFKSVACSIPMLHISQDEYMQHKDAFIEILTDKLCETQDKVLKAAYEKANGVLPLSIAEEEFSLPKLLQMLQESEGSRITKEFVIQWCNTNIRDTLTVLIADRMGIEDIESPEFLQILAQQENGIYPLFANLLDKNPALSKVQVQNLAKILSMSGTDDRIAQKLNKKLEEMQSAQSVSLLDML